MSASDLMGVHEVAEYYGVSRQLIDAWRKRGKLPPPRVTLAMGTVWNRKDFEFWPHPSRSKD